jgi:mannosyltransferase
MADVALDSRNQKWDLARLPWHIFIPVGLCLAIGVWGIDSAALWTDERETLFASSYPPAHMWEAPLVPYYFVMFAWTLTGDIASDAWLRLSSVVAMAVAVGFTTITATRVGSRRVALTAGLVMVLMPGVARYAQEARVYALATLLVALATYLLVIATQRTEKRWWVAYAVSLALVGVFAPFAYAVIPAHGVLLITDRTRRPPWRPWLIACAANLPVLAGVTYLAAHYGSMHDWLPAPGFSDLPTSVPLIALDVTYGFVLVAWALLSRHGCQWLAATAAGVLALWLLSLGPTSFWTQRSLVPLAPLLAVAAAFALGKLAWPQLVAAMTLLAVISWPFLVDQRQPGARGLDGKAMAEVIAANGRPGDVINTAINDWLSWSVQHYLPGDNRFTYAPSSTGRAWVLDSGVPCERLAEYQIPPEGVLVLCASLPDGWQDHVVRETP